MRQTGEETREFGIVGCLLLAIILACAAVSSLAQGAESGPGDVTSQRVEGGPARVGDVLEGPTSVPQDLKPGDGLVSPQFRSRFFKDAFAPWFEFRDKLKEDHYLNLGFDYTVIGQDSTSDLGAGYGIGHDLRFYGTWTLVNPGGPNSGAGVFKNWETFQHFEIGYSSSKKRWFLDNLHVTLWHADEREAAGLPEDWGISASYSWLFRNTWAPFLRVGWPQGRATLYEASVSTGFGYLTRQQDVFGLAVNWARPGGAVETSATSGPPRCSTSARSRKRLRSRRTSRWCWIPPSIRTRR